MGLRRLEPRLSSTIRRRSTGGSLAALSIFPGNVQAIYDTTLPNSIFQDSSLTTAANAFSLDLVGGVRDFSGNGYHATGSSTTRPVSCIDRGLPTLHFDATRQLTIPSGVTFNAQSLTVFIVYALRRNYTSNSGYVPLASSGQKFCVDLAESFGTSPIDNAAIIHAGGSVVDTGIITPCNESVCWVIAGASSCRYGYNEQRSATLSALTAGSDSGGNIGVRSSSADRFHDGTIRKMVIVSGACTEAQRVAMCNALYSSGNISPRRTQRVIFHGDSLTYGSTVALPDAYTMQAMRLISPQAEALIYGVPAQKINGGMATDAATYIDPHLDTSNFSRCDLVFWGGTNDIDGLSTGTQTYGFLQSYRTDRLAATWAANRLHFLTMLPRASSNGSFETERGVFNTDLRGSGYSIIDPAADARIGVAGANLDTTYFNVDQVHLNGTGYAIPGALAAPVIVS